MDAKADNHSLKVLGWKPETDVKKGIQKTLEGMLV